MATNLAGTGQALDTSLPTIYTEFRLLRDATGVARKCATKMKLDPHTGTSKNVLNYGRLLAYSLSDGVDMAQAQALADTNTAYTPAEVGVQVLLPWTTLRRVADPSLLRRTGRMMNNAYDLKEDSDGVAQFPSFTPIVGAATTVLGLGHALAALARIGIGNDRTNPEPAPKPHHVILHDLQLALMASRLANLAASQVGDASISDGVYGGQIAPGGAIPLGNDFLRGGPQAVGHLFGADFYPDANIVIDSSDDGSGAAFSQESLIYITEEEPRMLPDETDQSLRAVELNLVGSYVWGLYRASNYGCEILGSAVLPTS